MTGSFRSMIDKREKIWPRPGFERGSPLYMSGTLIDYITEASVWKNRSFLNFN